MKISLDRSSKWEQKNRGHFLSLPKHRKRINYQVRSLKRKRFDPSAGVFALTHDSFTYALYKTALNVLPVLLSLSWHGYPFKVTVVQHIFIIETSDLTLNYSVLELNHLVYSYKRGNGDSVSSEPF